MNCSLVCLGVRPGESLARPRSALWRPSDIFKKCSKVWTLEFLRNLNLDFYGSSERSSKAQPSKQASSRKISDFDWPIWTNTADDQTSAANLGLHQLISRQVLSYRARTPGALHSNVNFKNVKIDPTANLKNAGVCLNSIKKFKNKSL